MSRFTRLRGAKRLTAPRRIAGLAVLAALSGCVIVVRSLSVEEVPKPEASETVVESPLKAFLASGEIVVFPTGSVVSPDQVVGEGVRYSLDLEESRRVSSLPMDSIVGLEAFDGSINGGATVLASIGATAGVVLAAVGIACAADPKCFGSCPTVYTWEDGSEVLEAEAFSYSIAPLLEGRDVDRLGARPDGDGVLRLELRNEALETHYINHLEILQVDHLASRSAFPTESGRIVTVGRIQGVRSAVDRSGRSLEDSLGVRDGIAPSSPLARLESVTPEDHHDWIELVFPTPAEPTAALVLRLRNSLLNSVLFYDLMLGARGAEALNWLGRDIKRIDEAVELGRWFQETMGLRVEVHDGAAWREVARVPDTGPIAWEELAVRVPVPDTPELRVRLSFLVDEWRIDWVALGAGVEEADAKIVPLASVARIDAEPDASIVDLLAEPDDRYLITSAATAFSLEFRPTPSQAEQTFFLSSQGYYTEWIRPEWIRTGSPEVPFSPDGNTAVELVDRWMSVKDEFEARFFATRIPVR
jgi:hypothetical protein